MPSARRPARTALLLAAAPLALAIAAPAAPAAVSTVTTPNPGTSNTIGGLTAFPTDDVWAVGDTSSPSYSGCHGRTLTARFTGGAFAEIFETPAAPRSARPSTPCPAAPRRTSGRSAPPTASAIRTCATTTAPPGRRHPVPRCRRRPPEPGAITPPA